MKIEKYYENLIVRLISDNLGEEPEVVLNEYKENGYVELEKKDYFQVILKLEAILDITTGCLGSTEYNIYINKLAKYICSICKNANESLDELT